MKICSLVLDLLVRTLFKRFTFVTLDSVLALFLNQNDNEGNQKWHMIVSCAIFAEAQTGFF